MSQKKRKVLSRKKEKSFKIGLVILVLAGVLAIFTGCASGPSSENKETISNISGDGELQEFTGMNIFLAADLHFISPQLTDHGKYFTQMIESSDGKTMEYSDELMDAFVDTVLKQKPDALVLAGDLTFNGARKSHTDLVKKLQKIRKAGIPVLVLSGNHDLNNSNAASFHGDGYTKVESITAEEFEQLYHDFGYSRALSKDKASSSYVYELVPGLRLLMLDVNGVDTPCHVPEETLQWMEEQLKNAESDGCRVLSFSHQNLQQHSMFKSGYVIDNAGAVLNLYRKYGVSVNFTGHLHIQHIKKTKNFSEVATSALSIPPEHYARIRVTPQGLTYKTASVNVSDWAERNGSENPDLLHFRSYAKKFYLRTCRIQAENELAEMKDGEQKEKMVDYFARRNYAYFSGQPWKEKEGDREALAAWRKTDSFIGSYLGTLPGRIRTDENHLNLTFHQ